MVASPGGYDSLISVAALCIRSTLDTRRKVAGQEETGMKKRLAAGADTADSHPEAGGVGQPKPRP